jgi:hypothetical protein
METQLIPRRSIRGAAPAPLLQEKRRLSPHPRSSDLDYLNSSNLEEIEECIRRAWITFGSSILAIGTALERIRENGLWQQARTPEGRRCASFSEYLKLERVGLPKSSASEYMKICRLYNKHRHALQKAGFREETGLRKLLFLEKALSVMDGKVVYERLASESYRDFRAFVRMHTPPAVPRKQRTRAVSPEFRFVNNTLFHGNREILSITLRLDPPKNSVDHLRQVHNLFLFKGKVLDAAAEFIAKIERARASGMKDPEPPLEGEA